MTAILKAKNEWVEANDKAVAEASKYLGKNGSFNPPLEKPWPKWEELRKIADAKWCAYSKLLAQLVN